MGLAWKLLAKVELTDFYHGRQMIRLAQSTLCLILGVFCPFAAAAKANGMEPGLCARMDGFSTLSGLCKTLMRILPIRPEPQGEAAISAPKSEPAREGGVEPESPQLAMPLDLTLPPDFALNDQSPFQAPRPLLPALVGGPAQKGPFSVSGRLLTSDSAEDFEFDLGAVIDQIDGAEISIQILR